MLVNAGLVRGSVVKARYALAVHMIRLTQRQEIALYKSVHPDDRPMTPLLITAPRPTSSYPFGRSNASTARLQNLSGVFEAGLADLNYLFGNQFGERIVSIFYTDGAQDLFVGRRKPGDLFWPQR